MSSADVHLHCLGLHGRHLIVADFKGQTGVNGDGGQPFRLRLNGAHLPRVKVQLLFSRVGGGRGRESIIIIKTH